LSAAIINTGEDRSSRKKAPRKSGARTVIPGPVNIGRTSTTYSSLLVFSRLFARRTSFASRFPPSHSTTASTASSIGSSTIANGSEVHTKCKYFNPNWQFGLKSLHFRGRPPSRPLVLTPPSTSTVPATRKIYNASLQAEGYSQAASQHPRLPARASTGFAKLNPGQVQACGGGCQQADIRTQGHGCSVQGAEVAASSDVQHQASDLDEVRPFPFSSAYAKQGHQAIWEASDRPGEVF
jgi:hypothetical protein